MNATNQTPRPRRRDARANREAILVAAARVLRRDPEAAVDAVAAEAGLSRRAVYGHFSSREELLSELIGRGTAQIAAALSDVHDDDPAAHVARIGDVLWGQISHVRLVAQVVVRGPLEGAVARGLEPIRASLRDAVARGAAAGVFRDDVDHGIVARLIEESALAVLDEVVRRRMADEDARRLVVVTALGVAGLSWRDASAVADAVSGAPGGAE
ncbi:TetR family transcriptional regulator [Microbacterium betulae]|uniref:TetR family transcriptional regulator n=1 Tax=Microbacterium betulae TaxID=2981139 RepID=A0AA97FKD5_9MICO|nr:TetR family transcriptional regulator [Microbacterium sp. AB]WOF24393.1 TetR family transcriptional regulator [Microbacterium sp. AB]